MCIRLSQTLLTRLSYIALGARWKDYLMPPIDAAEYFGLSSGVRPKARRQFSRSSQVQSSGSASMKDRIQAAMGKEYTVVRNADGTFTAKKQAQEYVQERDSRTKVVARGEEYIRADFVPREVIIDSQGKVIKEIERGTYTTERTKRGYKKGVYEKRVIDYRRQSGFSQDLRRLKSGRQKPVISERITEGQVREYQVIDQDDPNRQTRTPEQRAMIREGGYRAMRTPEYLRAGVKAAPRQYTPAELAAEKEAAKTARVAQTLSRQEVARAARQYYAQTARTLAKARAPKSDSGLPPQRQSPESQIKAKDIIRQTNQTSTNERLSDGKVDSGLADRSGTPLFTLPIVEKGYQAFQRISEKTKGKPVNPTDFRTQVFSNVRNDPTAQEFLKGVKEIGKEVLSPVVGVGKMFYAPNRFGGAPLIDLGQDKLLKTEGPLLQDKDVQSAIGTAALVGAALTPYLGPVVKAGTVGFGAYSGVKEIGKGDPESIGKGSFDLTLAGLGVFGLRGRTGFLRDVYVKVGGQKVPRSYVSDPAVVSGKQTFPTSKGGADTLRQFQSQESLLQGTEGIQTFHATTGSFGKQFVVDPPSKGPTETRGLYVGPKISEYFLRIKQGPTQYSFWPEKSPQPSVLSIGAKDVQRVPENILSKDPYESVRLGNIFLKESARKDVAYVTPRSEKGFTPEAESVFAEGGLFERQYRGNFLQNLKGFRYYTEVDGKPVPILEYGPAKGSGSGLLGSSGQKTQSVSSSRFSYDGYLLPQYKSYPTSVPSTYGFFSSSKGGVPSSISGLGVVESSVSSSSPKPSSPSVSFKLPTYDVPTFSYRVPSQRSSSLSFDYTEQTTSLNPPRLPKYKPPTTPIYEPPVRGPPTTLTGLGLFDRPPRRGRMKVPKDSSKKRPLVEGFDVFVRERGEFFKAGVGNLSREAALSLGARITGGSSAASFLLRPSGRGARRQSDSFFRRMEGMFYSRSSKSGDTLFIERRKFRIDTPGEVAQIPGKARRKKRERNLFDFGQLIF